MLLSSPGKRNVCFPLQLCIQNAGNIAGESIQNVHLNFLKQWLKVDCAELDHINITAAAIRQCHHGHSNDARYDSEQIRSMEGQDDSKDGLRNLHCIQTRYIFNCRLRFTCSRRSIKFCSSTSPAPSANSDLSSSKYGHIYISIKYSVLNYLFKTKSHVLIFLCPILTSYHNMQKSRAVRCAA